MFVIDNFMFVIDKNFLHMYNLGESYLSGVFFVAFI